jgi:hypothetical protein
MTGVLVLLLVFYAGAVVASGRAWLGAWRGSVRFSELRDLTGIGDQAALRRLFGLVSPSGFYRVAVADVVRHRRSAGVVLTNLPVHLLFLSALGWGLLGAGAPAAAAIALAASAHAALLALVAASVLIGSRRALID